MKRTSEKGKSGLLLLLANGQEGLSRKKTLGEREKRTTGRKKKRTKSRKGKGAPGVTHHSQTAVVTWGGGKKNPHALRKGGIYAKK